MPAIIDPAILTDFPNRRPLKGSWGLRSNRSLQRPRFRVGTNREHLGERMLSSVEMCAGAGGQALGLELGGFAHAALIANDLGCCATLRRNRPQWSVFRQDLGTF